MEKTKFIRTLLDVSEEYELTDENLDAVTGGVEPGISFVGDLYNFGRDLLLGMALGLANDFKDKMSLEEYQEFVSCIETLKIDGISEAEEKRCLIYINKIMERFLPRKAV